MNTVLEDKAAWTRESAPAPPDARQIERILSRAVPGRALQSIEPLPGGLSNGMYRIGVAGLTEALVLRIHTRDAAACRKEADLHRLVAARVPVPEILHADCTGDGEIGAHMVMRWIEGLTFRQIKQRGDAREIAECARAIGAALARIGEFRFDRPGTIGPGLAIGAPLMAGAHPIPTFVEKCLATAEFERRMELRDRSRLREFVWRWSPSLAPLDQESSLVHSDFGSPNLLLRPAGGRWTVAGVLDWEFAFSGPALFDVGHMMRYERRNAPRVEPHFSDAFRDHGGVLPANWRELARVLDLTALCEFLMRPQLPAEIVPEIVELTLATIEDRDAG
jgi:fructokinase